MNTLIPNWSMPDDHEYDGSSNTVTRHDVPDKCIDAIMFDETTKQDKATVHILNLKNEIIRSFCFDSDALQGYFRGNDNIFYQCKQHVPISALQIHTNDVYPTKFRRIAFDIILYMYENQAKHIQLGKEYFLKPTNRTVGRIASYGVVQGKSVVSADHCQNLYNNDVFYELYENIYPVPSRGKTKQTKKIRYGGNRFVKPTELVKYDVSAVRNQLIGQRITSGSRAYMKQYKTTKKSTRRNSKHKYKV